MGSVTIAGLVLPGSPGYGFDAVGRDGWRASYVPLGDGRDRFTVRDGQGNVVASGEVGGVAEAEPLLAPFRDRF